MEKNLKDESKQKGGFARAEVLTPTERKEIAMKAALARWDVKSETKDKSKRVQGGTTPSNVVMSAAVDDNSMIFPDILSLHVETGSTVADITYGKGVFWRRVPEGQYKVLGTDLKTGTRWDELPHEKQSVDAVIFDPPYVDSFKVKEKTRFLMRFAQLSKGVFQSQLDNDQRILEMKRQACYNSEKPKLIDSFL